MREYLISVFVICFLTGVLGRVSFSGGEFEKTALLIITLFVIASPLTGLIGNFSLDSVLPPEGEYDGMLDEGYVEIAEQAFSDGIKRAIEEKFLLESDGVRVRVFGFDFNNMRAESIKVILSGKAATADYRRIKAYVDSLDVGECEVNIEIG